ncbi:helix-hairpin-helix domain-containing protein [Pseudoglutamicibacter cumminsii]|uniref:Helix-hairpin-helix domain-containing protein n=1 Tax=Pseudoglutamicibacter cumminsii TaxID=156979 RepID=A0AAP4C8F0_9MICC|nr:helix-hairpin-helix domain-containing protein [Pseudoglutamicibacter cumminsii]MDK6275896.1 helix-hairpin-helix domain-containing protein [Pseudoglutamicibacter cumminsii]
MSPRRSCDPVARDQPATELLSPEDPDEEYSWLDEPSRRPLLGRWGIGALALALCVLVAVLAFRFLGSSGGGLTSAEVVTAKSDPAPEPVTKQAPTPRTEPRTTAGTPSRIRVHVVGAVKKPGLYELEPGSIAADAVKKAGGLSRKADQAGINLAAPVNDGEQIRVPQQGEVSSNTGGGPPGNPDKSGNADRSESAADSAAGAGSSPVVRINSASADELQQLPGVGPALAQRILDFRSEHGPFRGPADLDAVSGIGPSILGKIEKMVSYD